MANNFVNALRKRSGSANPVTAMPSLAPSASPSTLSAFGQRMAAAKVRVPKPRSGKAVSTPRGSAGKVTSTPTFPTPKGA